MVEQIAYGTDIQLPVEELGARFAHAADELDIALEVIHNANIMKSAEFLPPAVENCG